MSKHVLDDLLRDAPIPPLASGVSDDASWDEHGDAVFARVKADPRGDAATLDALLVAPALEPEPGEPPAAEVTSRVAPASIREQVGATKMSESDRPKPSQRRPSLKELAERVSKTPPPPSVSPASTRPSAPPSPPSSLSAVATPPPSSLRTPIPSAPASPSAARVSAPPSAAAPASIPASASSERVSAPPSEAPASAAPAAAEKLAPVVPLAAAKLKKEEESGGGKGGLIVAGLGIAAAAALFFFLKSSDDAQKKAAATQTPTPATTVIVTATAEATQTAQAEAPKPAGDEKKDDTLDLEDLAEASGSASASSLAGTGFLPGSASALAGNDSKDPKQPFVPNPDGTLDDAMRKAAGDPDKKDETPQPASEDKGPKNVPDQPPVGSVNAFVASARAAAKGCVAGADAPTTATVTFSSSGAVSKVSVGGWAAGKPAASCVDGAMRGKGVEAFSKPSYSVTVTVRP
ncbi:MAG: hypothetical protein IPM79_33550 [Polyangiaceae bacterium]|nr:hypothetical protein [Polyangiaceae bacterium]